MKRQPPRCDSPRRALRTALWAGICCACFSVPFWINEGVAAAADDAPANADVAVPAKNPEDDAAIRRQLDEILSQPMFRRVHARPEEKPPPPDIELPTSSLFGWLGLLSFAGQAIAFAILAVICGAIVFLFIHMLAKSTKLSGLKPTRPFEEGAAEIDLPPGELPADVYVTRAEELARQGRYQEAIGQLLLGAMSSTEREGLIRFRRGLTYRDYIRALRTRENRRAAFRALVGVYEPLRFGHREARSEHYDTCLTEYRAGFAHA